MEMTCGASSSNPVQRNQRMELRALILLASEIIADYWPMRTFVHHNPLHGLEDLHFEEAVSRARRLRGSNGYLPVKFFATTFRCGRILPDQLDAALKTRADDRRVRLGAHDVALEAVLRACMLQDLSAPPNDTLNALLERHPERKVIGSLANHLLSAVKPSRIGGTRQSSVIWVEL